MNLLAEDLLQLTSDDNGVLADQWDIDSMLAGSVLADLVLIGAVEFAPRDDKDTDPRVHSTPGQRMEDPLLRLGYDQISEKTRKSSEVVEVLSGKVRATLLDRLESRGLVRERKKKRFLGIFPQTSWTLTSTDPREELRAQLTQSMRSQQGADPRTAALFALLNTIGRLDDGISTDAGQRGELLYRAEQVAFGSSAGAAVNESLQAALAATTTAVATALIVTSTVASGAATS